MKKLLLAFVAVLSLGTSSLALADYPQGQLRAADTCAVHPRVCRVPLAPRVVVVAPVRHRVYRWVAWHRDHRFHRYF
jgi:hypothetical protein